MHHPIIARIIVAAAAGLCSLAAQSGPAPATVLLDQYTSLATSDPTFNRPLSSVPCTDLSGTGTAVYYKTFTITAAAGAPLYVTMSGFEGTSSFDTFVTVYGPSFDPNNPLTNCLGADDDSGVQTDSHVVIPSPAGGTYTVVASSFFNADVGDFRVCASQGQDVLATCLEPRSLIPTLSEWGLGGLAVLMGLFGAWTVRRRRA